MKFNFFLILIIILGINKFAYSDEINCNEFDKFSSEFLKCKANIIKNKAVNAGQNFVEDTKEYQKKEWSKEKGKIDKLKEKFLEK